MPIRRFFASASDKKSVGRHLYGSTAKSKELARERVRSHPGHAHGEYALLLFAQRQTPRNAHRTGSRSAKRVGRLRPQRDRRQGGAGSRNQQPYPFPPTFGFSGTGAKAGRSGSSENYPRSARAAASSRGNKGGTLAGYFRRGSDWRALSAGATNPNRSMPTIKAARHNRSDYNKSCTPLFFGASLRSEAQRYDGQSGSHETRKTKDAPGTRGLTHGSRWNRL